MPAHFDPRLMSRHAVREARREKIPTDMIELTYEEPDERVPSRHDDLRELRTRWFGERGLVVVVDIDDGRVVTVWRSGRKR